MQVFDDNHLQLTGKLSVDAVSKSLESRCTCLDDGGGFATKEGEDEDNYFFEVQMFRIRLKDLKLKY